MPEKNHLDMISLYRGLMKARPDLEYGLVLHHIDELEDATSEFGDLPVFMSYDEHDYQDLYANFDFVVTPRVHGCGMAASLGLPSVLLPIDFRADTADGFLSTRTYDLEDVLGALRAAPCTHDRLCALRARTFDEYVSLLRQAL